MHPSHTVGDIMEISAVLVVQIRLPFLSIFVLGHHGNARLLLGK